MILSKKIFKPSLLLPRALTLKNLKTCALDVRMETGTVKSSSTSEEKDA